MGFNPLDIVTDIPIVGDIAGGLFGHASASELQEDSQAHSEAQHEKDMFGLESDWSSAQSKTQYERQRELLYDSPGLQMKGLKAAGLNPILAATGGFKSPAGGTLPIPTARAGSSAKGGGAGMAQGSKFMFGVTQEKVQSAKLMEEKRDTEESMQDYYNAEAAKKRSEQLGIMYDNVRKANLASIDESELGMFFAYLERAKVRMDSIVGITAGVFSAAKLWKMIPKSILKRAPNPFKKGTKQYYEFERNRKLYRGKN
jgi:hypothetical protein